MLWQDKENGRARLCLFFSICLITIGFIVLILTTVFVVRYQVHSAWFFHQAQCEVTSISNTTLHTCSGAGSCTNTSACSEWRGDVQCIVVEVIHYPEFERNRTGGSTATYYRDVAALWENSECSFVSPSCDESPAEAEQFHSLIQKWKTLQETGELFDCYGGNKKNKHEVIGARLYTSTLAYLVILLPVLMMCVGFGIGGWSCCELLCCNPQIRHERYMEKQKEKKKTEQKNKYHPNTGAGCSGCGGAPRGRIGANRQNKFYPNLSPDTDAAAPMIESEA